MWYNVSGGKLNKTQNSPGKIKARNSGFTIASNLVPDLTQKAFEKRGFSQSKLVTNWDDVVGLALCKVSKPVKISFPKGDLGATLTIEIDAAYGPEIDMQKDIIKEKVNRLYGYTSITKIKLKASAVIGYQPLDANITAADHMSENVDGNEIFLSEKVMREISLGLERVRNEKLRDTLKDLSHNFAKNQIRNNGLIKE